MPRRALRVEGKTPLAFVGIGLFDLPASILASGFIDEARSEQFAYCPLCGEKLQ